MMMPVRLSAVGDGCRAGQSSCVAVRQVLGVSFPSLCLMLKASHSAEEIETACSRMPLVRSGKAARGTNAGRRQWPEPGRRPLATKPGLA
jgi:hypothetical protein